METAKFAVGEKPVSQAQSGPGGGLLSDCPSTGSCADHTWQDGLAAPIRQTRGPSLVLTDSAKSSRPPKGRRHETAVPEPLNGELLSYGSSFPIEIGRCPLWNFAQKH